MSVKKLLRACLFSGIRFKVETLDVGDDQARSGVVERLGGCRGRRNVQPVNVDASVLIDKMAIIIENLIRNITGTLILNTLNDIKGWV